MKALITHHSSDRAYKKSRFNPHRYWALFFIVFITSFFLEIAYFSWYFSTTIDTLDAPAVVTEETNAAKIQSIEKSLDVTEAALNARIRGIPTTSQNSTPVVQ